MCLIPFACLVEGWPAVQIPSPDTGTKVIFPVLRRKADRLLSAGHLPKMVSDRIFMFRNAPPSNQCYHKSCERDDFNDGTSSHRQNREPILSVLELRDRSPRLGEVNRLRGPPKQSNPRSPLALE